MELYPHNWLNLLPALAGGSLLMLAAMNVALAWRRQGSAARGHLLFAVIAASAAATGVFDFLLMNTRTIDQYGALLRASHIPISLLVLSIPWFVLFLFGAGRRWLAIIGNAPNMSPPACRENGLGSDSTEDRRCLPEGYRQKLRGYQ